MMEWVRPAKQSPLGTHDAEVFKAEIDRIGAKSVLEFGPGESTQVFLDLGIERIVTCEHKEKWLKEAVKRFGGSDRVKVIPYTDTVPVQADIGDEKFDLALVDSPQGFYPARVVHKGMEDCSRLNTCLFALEHAKVVLLHDALRPLERGTLGRLWMLGYHFEFIKTDDIGIARITKRELHANQPDPSDAEKPRGAAAGAKPKRRRGRVNRRSDQLGDSGSEAKEHRGRGAVVNVSDDSGRATGSPGVHSSERGEDGVRGDQRNGALHLGATGGEDAS